MHYGHDELEDDFTGQVALSMLITLDERGLVGHLKRMSKLWEQHNDKRYTRKQRNAIKKLLNRHFLHLPGISLVLDRITEWANNSIADTDCIGTRYDDTFTEAPGA